MSLKAKTISGVKWTTFATIALALFGIVKFSVLARFLDASDFGLMALVTFMLGFMDLFMDMGLTSAILHKQEISKNEYTSLYWINFIFSFILFALISFSSPFIGAFYNESELVMLIPITAISIILSALGRQFKTIEQKQLNFKYIALTDIVGAAIGLIVSVITASNGFGVYALVYGGLVQYAVSNSIYFINGLRERGLILRFRYTDTKPFLKIGIYQVGGQIVNYFNRDLDILLIGKFFGSEILGGYSLAKQLVRHPLKIINPIIDKVGISVFPKIQHDSNALRKYFMKIFIGMGALNAFLYGSIAICAYWLVVLLYGLEFIHIVPLVQLFTVVTYLRSMGGNTGILVITTGRTDVEFIWNVLSIIITPIVIFIGAQHSIEAVIFILGMIQMLMLIPGWYMFFHRLIALEFWPFLKSHLFPMTIAVLIFPISFFTLSSDSIYQFVFSFLLFIILSIYVFLNVSEFRQILVKIKLKYARI